MATFEMSLPHEKTQGMYERDRGIGVLLEPIANQILKSEMREDLRTRPEACSYGRRGTNAVPIVKAIADFECAFAVDINEDALTSLHDNVKEHHIDNVTTVLAVCDDPMLPRDAFATVLVRNTDHEFGAPKKMLRRTPFTLNSSGRLDLAEPI